MLISISTMPVGDNIEKLKNYVKQIESFADFLHLDVCDGKYNATKCFLPKFAKEINQNTTLPLDCHLMTKNALDYAKEYILAGANIVSAQLESFETESETSEFVDYVKSHNTLVGLAIEPNTDVQKLLPYLKDIDTVLLMSVPTGKSGQKFDECVFEKIKFLKEYRLKNNFSFKIEIDGGINDKIAPKLKDCGADMVVSGNYVYLSKDKEQAIVLLK